MTGGAGHIGSALCDALAEVGARLAILDLSKERCFEVSESIQSRFGVETLALPVDLRDEERLRAAPNRVMERFGRIDILVHCAAFVGTSSLSGWAVPFPEQGSESWRSALEVNLTSIFLLSQGCLPALKSSGKGSIINMSSIYGLVGPDMRLYEGTSMGNPAAYAASKGGLIQLTRWLAAVLAPEVRVNAVSAGGVLRGQAETFREKYVERTPLRRMATEEDLKGAAVYLASDLSSYVTGQNIIVDGGWTAW